MWNNQKQQKSCFPLCQTYKLTIIMPPPLGDGGIMFSGCPSVRPSVHPSVPPKPEIPSFDLYMDPLVHPTNRDRFTACPSVRPSVCPSKWLPDRNRKSMGWGYWELMSHPDPAVLPVGTLHSLEWFWVSRRIFVYSHHNTIVFFSKTSIRAWFVC